jgi:hypothetical protein
MLYQLRAFGLVGGRFKKPLRSFTFPRILTLWLYHNNRGPLRTGGRNSELKKNPALRRGSYSFVACYLLVLGVGAVGSGPLYIFFFSR